MLAHGEGKDVLGRFASGDLCGLVPELEEGVEVVVHREHRPEAVGLEQLREGAALPLVVRQPLQESVLKVNDIKIRVAT